MLKIKNIFQIMDHFQFGYGGMKGLRIKGTKINIVACYIAKTPPTSYIVVCGGDATHTIIT